MNRTMQSQPEVTIHNAYQSTFADVVLFLGTTAVFLMALYSGIR